MYAAGQRLGDYLIMAAAGAGGMGEVYRAQHLVTGRSEALKVLRAGISQQGRDRFQREIVLQAKLDHPHIAAVRHAFEHEGAPVLVLEWVDGEPLSRRLARGPLPFPAAVARGSGAAAAASGVLEADGPPADVPSLT